MTTNTAKSVDKAQVHAVSLARSQVAWPEFFREGLFFTNFWVPLFWGEAFLATQEIVDYS